MTSEDTLIKTISVYLEPCKDSLYLLQMPLQARPLASAAVGSSVANFTSDNARMHVKFNTNCVRLKTGISTHSHVYDQNAGERYQDAMRLDRQQQVSKMNAADQQSLMDDKDEQQQNTGRFMSHMSIEGRDVLKSSASSVGEMYHAVFGKEGELYLRKVDACVPLRPSLAHLDASDRCDKKSASNANNDGSTDNDSGASDMDDPVQKALQKQAASSMAAMARKQSLQKKTTVEVPSILSSRHKLQREIEDEQWVPITKFHDSTSVAALEYSESLYINTEARYQKKSSDTMEVDASESKSDENMMVVLTTPQGYGEKLNART